MNITRQDRYHILGTKTRLNIFYPMPLHYWKRHCICQPFDSKFPLRPVEIEFENNRCCLEVYNTSNRTVEFQYGHKIAHFDARSKGLVQINNSKHFPIDQYLHDRVTPVTLSPKPLVYDEPIDPKEMPCISTFTEIITEDMNVPTQDDKYPWLDPDDK